MESHYWLDLATRKTVDGSYWANPLMAGIVGFRCVSELSLRLSSQNSITMGCRAVVRGKLFSMVPHSRPKYTRSFVKRAAVS